jgi:hypothetical protein
MDGIGSMPEGNKIPVGLLQFRWKITGTETTFGILLQMTG